jgi:hypothetical protein
MRCVVCNGKKLFQSQGRIIAGDWFKDQFIPKEYWGKWVCCYSCYEKLLARGNDKDFMKVKP